MLDNEPDANDNPTAPSVTDQPAGSESAPPARRRRRAATRQAGPPSVHAEPDSGEQPAAATPVMIR